MKELFDDRTVPIVCTNCGHKTPKSIGWLEAHSRFACACGTIVATVAGQFRGEIARSYLVLESLKRNMELIGKSWQLAGVTVPPHAQPVPGSGTARQFPRTRAVI